MKKRFFAAVLALVMVLGLAAPIGLVVPAEAASADALKDIAYYGDRSTCKLTAEQAQAYADLLNSGLEGRALLFQNQEDDWVAKKIYD